MAAARAQRFDQARLINIANALTAMRVLLVPLFAYLLISGEFLWALAIFASCGLTDGLDGLLARRLRQRTVVGFYLDPIADKLLMATSFIMLAYVRIVPFWLTILIISRDLFIIIGSVLFLILLTETDIRPTILSKFNTAVQILTVLFFLASRAFPEAVASVSGGYELSGGVVVLCAGTTALSGIQYLWIGIRKLSS